MSAPAKDGILRQRRVIGPVSQFVLVAVIAGAIGFGFWARGQTFTAAAKGVGFVAAAPAPVRVLSEIGGTLLPYEVRDGEAVSEGQRLFRVESVTEVAERRANVPASKALRAELARLVAEAEDHQQLAFPADLADSPEAQREGTRFAERRAEFERERQSRRDAVRQTRLEIAGQRAAAEQAARARDLAQKELEVLGPLVDRGISPKLEYLRVQQKVQALDAQREKALLAVPRLEAAIREMERAEERADAEFRSRAKRLLAEKRKERAAETLPAVTTRRQVTVREIRAPVGGRATRVPIDAAGRAVGAGQELAIIAPSLTERFIDGQFPANAGVELRRNQKVLIAHGNGRDFNDVEAEIVDIAIVGPDAASGGEVWTIKLRVRAGMPGFDKLTNAGGGVLITATSEQPILDYIWNRLIVASGGRFTGRLTGQ